MDGSREERVPDPPEPERDRVDSRSKSIRREHPEAEDPDAAAEEGLKDSDARTNDDPAPRDLEEEGVERRTSDEATAPSDGSA
jgi:hypothetical protein